YDDFRVGDGGEVVACRTDHEADHLTAVNVQTALLDQVDVHRAVEKAVVGDVVDVAVDVVVVPARGDRLEMSVIGTQVLRLFGHSVRSVIRLVSCLVSKPPGRWPVRRPRWLRAGCSPANAAGASPPSPTAAACLPARRRRVGGSAGPYVRSTRPAPRSVARQRSP